MKRATYILVHSPLVGPLTWKPVAEWIRRNDRLCIVPELTSPDGLDGSYWRRHADEVAKLIDSRTGLAPIVLVGHSGAGVLLPAIRESYGLPVQSYVFVDAAIPSDGMSRLDLFESPEAAERFRSRARDGLLPPWTDMQLRMAIHDEDVRASFVSELEPLPIKVYEEPVPVFAGWPDARCGYVQLTPPYDAFADAATRNRWTVMELEGTHFHMLNEPEEMTRALLDVETSLFEL